MKLNVTRDLSQEMAVPAFTTTKYNPVDKNQNRSTGAQANRTTSTRITATSANGSSISVFAHYSCSIVLKLVHFI